MSSTEIMVNTIEVIIMEDRSLMVREMGAMLDNSIIKSIKASATGVVCLTVAVWRGLKTTRGQM